MICDLLFSNITLNMRFEFISNCPTPILVPRPPFYKCWGRPWYGEIIGANRGGNLDKCISITDEVKINEQKNSVATGSIYVYSTFEAI